MQLIEEWEKSVNSYSQDYTEEYELFISGSNSRMLSGELATLLSRAGALAASMGISLDAWMKDAWSAYVDARPGLREHLEDMQLIAQLNELRQNGRIGQA